MKLYWLFSFLIFVVGLDGGAAVGLAKGIYGPQF